MSRRKKWHGCNECGHLARHPLCPFCQKKMHYVGGLIKLDEEREEVDRNAPIRRIEDRISVAYLLPFMVEFGQIPKDDLQRITRQVLGGYADVLADSQVWGFRFSSHPYKFKVIEADLTGKVPVYVKIRYGGWSCKNHRGAVPSDLPATVLQRDEMSCIVCGMQRALVVTYMIPPEEDGELKLANMATFCSTCSNERGNLDYWSFLKQKGISMNPLIIDFKTGYVRSAMKGNYIRL